LVFGRLNIFKRKGIHNQTEYDNGNENNNIHRKAHIEQTKLPVNGLSSLVSSSLKHAV